MPQASSDQRPKVSSTTPPIGGWEQGAAMMLNNPNTYGQMMAQAQPPQTPMGGQPAQPMDPESHCLAMALANMGKQTQGSGTGLGENLLASPMAQPTGAAHPER